MCFAARRATQSNWAGTEITTVLGLKSSRVLKDDSGLVVEELLGPAMDHDLRNDDGDDIVGLLPVDPLDEVQDRLGDLAERRVEDLQLHAALQGSPARAEFVDADLVYFDADRDEALGVQGLGVCQRVDDVAVQPAHEEHDGVVNDGSRSPRYHRELLLDLVIVAFDQ